MIIVIFIADIFLVIIENYALDQVKLNEM